MSSIPNGLVHLPAELISQITVYLDYPDILSLHLVHPRFFYSPLLDTDNDAGIRLRGTWLFSITSCNSLLTPSYQPDAGNFPFPLFRFRFTLPSWLSAPSTSNEIERLRRKACTQVVFRTNAEFLMNSEIQRILRDRFHHVACREDDCRVVPGTVCLGPRNKSGHSAFGLPSLILAMYKEVVMSMKEHDFRLFLCTWDIWFLLLITLGLVQVVQEVARWLGNDLGVHSAGMIVLATSTVFGRSLFTQSRAYSRF